ncbi:MAG: hypothetical protein HKN82_20300 [Akkermansiaceae bacterium]|nr:hypothetical protein [Akkermansiaceae bacterium]
MNQDRNPNEIEELKAILAKSLDPGEGEDVPPMPDSLRDRISGQWGKGAAVGTNPPGNLFTRFTALFAQPAWAGAAAAVALLLVAAVVFINPRGDTLRGSSGQVDPVAIVLYKLDPAAEQAIKDSGYFEVQALHVVRTEEELRKVGPPKIVIDGPGGNIVAHATGGTAPRITSIPADPSQLAGAVAELLRGLK